MDNTTIYSRFAQWVKQNPDAPAIIEEGRQASYKELDLLADRIFGNSPRYKTGKTGIKLNASK